MNSTIKSNIPLYIWPKAMFCCFLAQLILIIIIISICTTRIPLFYIPINYILIFNAVQHRKITSLKFLFHALDYILVDAYLIVFAFLIMSWQILTPNTLNFIWNVIFIKLILLILIYLLSIKLVKNYHHIMLSFLSSLYLLVYC